MGSRTMITLKELEDVWENANFGENHTDKMRLVKQGLIKWACGYRTGYTLQCILQEVGLLTKKTKRLTKRGQFCLYEFFRKESEYI